MPALRRESEELDSISIARCNGRGLNCMSIAEAKSKMRRSSTSFMVTVRTSKLLSVLSYIGKDSTTNELVGYPSNFVTVDTKITKKVGRPFRIRQSWR